MAIVVFFDDRDQLGQLGTQVFFCVRQPSQIPEWFFETISRRDQTSSCFFSVHFQRTQHSAQTWFFVQVMFNGKRRSSSGASSTCSTAREDPPAEHQVHVQRQEKILQRSIKYMFNSKRRSSSGASSTCSTAREDPPAEHQVHVQQQEKILQRSITSITPPPHPNYCAC